MKVETTSLDGVFVLTPKRHQDQRGWFSEVWNHRSLNVAGIDVDFVQDNQSLSAKPGTVRGLHYQAPPHGQAKLVRCSAGAVYDVAVDARKGSRTFGQHVGTELSAENGRQLFIPIGFLHGFMTLTPNAEVQYKCSHYFEPSADGAVLWNSADLAIDWPEIDAPLISEKDCAAPEFSSWSSPFVFEEQMA